MGGLLEEIEREGGGLGAGRRGGVGNEREGVVTEERRKRKRDGKMRGRRRGGKKSFLWMHRTQQHFWIRRI